MCSRKIANSTLGNTRESWQFIKYPYGDTFAWSRTFPPVELAGYSQRSQRDRQRRIPLRFRSAVITIALCSPGITMRSTGITIMALSAGIRLRSAECSGRSRIGPVGTSENSAAFPTRVANDQDDNRIPKGRLN
jgi:hypothetical protein